MPGSKGGTAWPEGVSPGLLGVGPMQCQAGGQRNGCEACGGGTWGG